MVVFELQMLHVVSELDLLFSNIPEFISKSGILDFKWFRNGGGVTLSQSQCV